MLRTSLWSAYRHNGGSAHAVLIPFSEQRGYPLRNGRRPHTQCQGHSPQCAHLFEWETVFGRTNEATPALTNGQVFESRRALSAMLLKPNGP